MTERSPPYQNLESQANVLAIGYWSAIAVTLATVGFLVAVVVSSMVAPTPPPWEWSGIEAYAASFQPIEMLPFVPALLLALAFIVLMLSVHHYAPADKKIWSQIGAALAVIYATVVSISYYVQLTVVRQNLLNGETEGLALFAAPNPHSLFFALEALGYGFMGLATLAIIPIFPGEKIERWVRRLFIVNGALSILGVIGYALDDLVIIFGGLVVWSVIFPIASALLAVLFRRAVRALV